MLCTLKSGKLVFQVAGVEKSVSFGTKSSNYRTTELDRNLGQHLHFTDENAKKQRYEDTCQGHKTSYQESQD